MTSVLFATNGHDATPEDLRRTAQSLRLGVKRATWYVSGSEAPLLSGRARRITIGDGPGAEWVIFLPAGDSITRDFEPTLKTLPNDVDVYYGDTRHDIKRDDSLPTYQRRPSFSPERLRAHDYIGGFIAAKRTVVNAAGGLAALTNTDPHDRNLRITEIAQRVARIPIVLHVTPSINLLPDANPTAVSDHLQRRGIDARVEFDAETPAVRVRRPLRATPKVSVIIPTRGSSAELRGVQTPLVVNTVRMLLERSSYPNLEFVVVADTPTPLEVRTELQRLGGDRLLIVDYDKPFNFAVKNNIGVAHATGEYILLLNDDTEIITPDALETMLALFNDSTVGTVGPMLYFEDGTIQSAGHVFTPDPKDIYRCKPAIIRGAHNYVRVQREASSVIAACLLTSRVVFEAVGGFSTQFPGNWNDIDFALKVQQAGYRVIFTPHAKFFHFESKTRVALRLETEVAKLGHRWGDILDDDPFFNPHLQRYHYMWVSDLHVDADHIDTLGPTAPISPK